MKFSKAWDNSSPKKARDLRRKPTTVNNEIEKLKQPDKKAEAERAAIGSEILNGWTK
jgi:hypothetical protein